MRATKRSRASLDALFNPLTSRPLHIYTGGDVVICENHDTHSLHHCPFDQGNKGEQDRRSIFSFDSKCSFLVDYCIEKLIKKIIGKTEVEVEIALRDLELFILEEKLTTRMLMARNPMMRLQLSKRSSRTMNISGGDAVLDERAPLLHF